MRPVLSIVFLLACSFTVPCQDSKGTSDAEQLIRLEQQIADAQIRKDMGFLKHVISREFFYTAPIGILTEIVVRRDKTDYLAKVKSRDVILKSINVGDIEVHQYGNMAVVTGRMIVIGQMKDGEVSYHELFTHTFKQSENQWELVAAHSSYIGRIFTWRTTSISKM
jgi:hypothetical protein